MAVRQWASGNTALLILHPRWSLVPVLAEPLVVLVVLLLVVLVPVLVLVLVLLLVLVLVLGTSTRC